MIPLAALAAGATGLWQVGSGINQAIKAGNVKLQDTRPESFREELSLRRQQANSQLMPGQKSAENRIQQTMANSTSALQQSGTGAAGILSGLTRLNQQANQANQQLADQAAAYQDRSRDQLAGTLRQDAAYRQQDLNNFNREKAALKQASAQNLFGGLSTLGSVGTYALGGGFKNDPSTGQSPYINSFGQTPQLGNNGYGYNPNQTLQLGFNNGMWTRLYSGNSGR